MPETLVGSGPFAEWRYHEMFESSLGDVMTFCRRILEDPDTLSADHPLP